MSNRKVSFLIRPKDIRDKFFPEYKEVRITNVDNTYNDGTVRVDCLILDEGVVEENNMHYVLLSDGEIPPLN